MKLKLTMKTLALALVLASPPPTSAAQEATPAATPAPMPAAKKAATKALQQSFATPEAAAAALADAVRAQDRTALLAVVGPASESWLASGDPVADREAWRKFLAAYEHKNSISRVADGRAFVLVGEDEWPFPAPLVERRGRWVFDTAAGREEIINRRIGRNELDTIQTLLAIVDAQREYAAKDLDGNGLADYARRFVSSAGSRDGLYWPVEDDQPQSPLGPLVGAATREGYSTASAAAAGSHAYHGYRYRMLTAQGKDAAGGAYDYLVGDQLIGGFAVLAYPAKYGVSGVMSFIVNHDGTVYQKNLGPRSETQALQLRSFNPGPGWKKVD